MRSKNLENAIILGINYLNKNATFVGLIKYSNGAMSFINLANGLFLGDFVKTIDTSFSHKHTYILGNLMYISLAPMYTIFSNITPPFKNKPKYSTSAGTYVVIIKKIEKTGIIVIELSNGIRKYVPGNTTVVVGRNSNIKNKFTCLGKASVNIRKGFKPYVRGIAMNPVDHPHGGRTKTNQPEMSPWGWVTKKCK